jgi:hypothetical protein
MNPTLPKIRGLVKLHKEHTPIRPIINLCNSPAYNLGKFVSKYLNSILKLPNSFNVKNYIEFIKDLLDIPINANTIICSFDITNMYTNIPIDKVRSCIQLIMSTQNLDNSAIKQVLPLVNVILDQNYFEHNTILKQVKVLAIGAPTSLIFSEIYLWWLEYEILKILLQNQIYAYFRYVDDILIIYNTEHTDICNTLKQFNLIHPDLLFTME